MTQRLPAGGVLMPREVLHLLLELRGESDMDTLRAAGDAGGGSLMNAFREWAFDADGTDPAELEVDAFTRRAAEFFEWCGWGDTSISTGAGSIIEVAITECWEAQRMQSPLSGCHLTTGLLHGFFAALAGYELGVMELECTGLGSGGSCRFLISTPEMVDSIYAGLSAGSSYEEVVSSVA